MNANEIMMELRIQSGTQPGIVTMPVEFDPGSLEDQLWETQGFYHSKGNVRVSMRRMPEYHAEFYEFECVELLEGKIRYWKMKGRDYVHVDPAHYEMMLAKRAECKIDYPMMFTDFKEFGDHWRWGVEESPECENYLRLFYQERKKDMPWVTTNFETMISVQVWGRIKKAARILFEVSDEEDKNPDDLYMEVSFQIFEDSSAYCFKVREHSDCEGCLGIYYEEREDFVKGWVEKCELLGSFNQEDWTQFASLVDKFIEEVF